MFCCDVYPGKGEGRVRLSGLRCVERCAASPLPPPAAAALRRGMRFSHCSNPLRGPPALLEPLRKAEREAASLSLTPFGEIPAAVQTKSPESQKSAGLEAESLQPFSMQAKPDLSSAQLRADLPFKLAIIFKVPFFHGPQHCNLLEFSSSLPLMHVWLAREQRIPEG